MKKISKFDLGMIIAFAVVGLLGGGAWWWLSGQLQEATDQARAAQSTFKSQSTSAGIVVSRANQKTLQDNIRLYTDKIDPLIQAKFFSKENKLPLIDKQDSVSWKHELNEQVAKLKTAAKDQGVVLPANYYFSFGRYTNQSPDDEQTAVLSKQLLAIREIVTLMIKAPVKGINSIRRTYEEDAKPNAAPRTPPSANANQAPVYPPATEPDRLSGFAYDSGGVYVCYPYEIEFDSSIEGLRKVLDNLLQSPYVFILRSISVQNSKLTSPQLSDFDRLAGPPPDQPQSILDSPPGQPAINNNNNRSPVFLFNNTPVRVKVRIDLIEWKTPPETKTDGK